MEKESINILLVADDEQEYVIIRKLLSDIEESSPFGGWVSYLEWVGTYESAVRMIQLARHDIYLIDSTFTVQTDDHPAEVHDGLALVRQVIADGCQIPLILLAQGKDNPMIGHALEAGVVDYLIKEQLNSPLLERALRHVIRGQRMQELQEAHNTLKQWARRRTTRLKRTNQQLRREIEVREQAEEALRQSEEKYRALVENIQDGVFLVQDGKIAFANDAFAKMLGYSMDELIGKKFLSLIARTDLEMIASQYGQMQVKKGVPKEYEFRLIHHDKSTRVMVNINVGLFTYQGKLASIGTVKDITVRKYTEEQLRKLSRVVHQSPISIMITDTNGNIEYVNPTFTEVTGYSLKEVIGQNPRILKSGEHEVEYYEQLWGTIASGSTWRGELRNRKKTGELYWEFATISPISSKAGKVTHYLAILEDITERKRVMAELRRHRHHLQELVDERTRELTEANEKLQQEINERIRLTEATRQSRERLRLQYNGIPVPTYTWQRVGRDFVLIDYNDAASKAIKGRIIDFMGKKASDMFGNKPNIMEDFKRCFITKKMIRREGPYQLLTTGETRHYITSYIYVPPNVVMVHMEDVTKYKETEEKLHECQERFEKLVNARADEVDAVNEKIRVDIEEWRQQQEPQPLPPPVPTNGNDEPLDIPLERSIVGTWSWNIETGEMEFSSEWAEMLGYTADEVKKTIRSWAGLMHLDDIARVMDNLNNHFAGETPYYEAEHRLKTKSGDWKWILGQGKVTARDKNGRVLQMTGIHRDISDRKQAEEALRRSHSWFQSLIETVSDWVWEVDRQFVYTYVSPKVQEILGYKPDEVLGKSPFDFMPSDEGKRMKAVFIRRMKSRKPIIAVESTNIRKNGKLVVLETNALPFFNEDGLFCGYRGAHQDVTNKQRAKE